MVQDSLAPHTLAHDALPVPLKDSMPPKSRISNLLNNFDFTVDDDPNEPFENSQGENALNALLSRSKKKDQVRVHH